MNRLLYLAILILLFPLFSHAQVTIYSQCNYRGTAVKVGPGNYYNSAMFSFPDRSLSALKIPPGYRVELYTGINMSGNVAVYSKNSSCLPSYINDKVRSMRITYNYNDQGTNINPYGGVSVFTECGFRGRYAYLPPGDYKRLRNVMGNDVISSMRIPEGMVIELFSSENFQGYATGKITSDNNCLGDFWINRASSARVSYYSGGWIPPKPPPPVANAPSIMVYAGCNYFGKATEFKLGDYYDLRHSLNNQPAGSMMIPKGITVELFSDRNLRGYSMGKYTSNKACLLGNIQYGAGSMRVYRTGGSGGIPPGGGGSSARGVTLYANCNYSGKNVVLAEGVYNDLSAYGNLSPASFKVPPGYEITLYIERNLRGTTTGRMSSNIDCLGTWIKNKARSAQVSRKSIPKPTPRTADE